MPWKEVTPMEEIIRFVTLANSGRFTVTELCEQFGISRKTGYKHLERYAANGLNGLQPRSHRPHEFPQRTDEAIEALILAERRLHRTWGPKKLHKVLQVKHGIESPPARSTIGEILRRHGLSVRRRRKPGAYHAFNDGLTEAGGWGRGLVSGVSETARSNPGWIRYQGEKDERLESGRGTAAPRLRRLPILAL